MDVINNVRDYHILCVLRLIDHVFLSRILSLSLSHSHSHSHSLTHAHTHTRTRTHTHTHTHTLSLSLSLFVCFLPHFYALFSAVTSHIFI